MENKELVVKGFDIPTDYLSNNSPKNSRISYLSLETKPICNAACLYCFSGPELNSIPNDALTLDEYQQILSQAKKLGIRTVVFSGVGEPTLDEKLTDLIRFNDRNDLTSIIYTNGLFNQNLTKFFHKHNTSILLKLDTLKPKTYKELVRGDYEKYTKSITSIFEIYKPEKAKSNVTRLGVCTVITDINKGELRELANFCDSHKTKHFVSGLAKVGWAKDNWERLVSDKKEIEKIVESYHTGVSSQTIDGRCGLYTYGITIDVNGDLIGCSMARWIRLGNIKRCALKDLINIYRETVWSDKPHDCLARRISLGSN